MVVGEGERRSTRSGDGGRRTEAAVAAAMEAAGGGPCMRRREANQQPAQPSAHPPGSTKSGQGQRSFGATTTAAARGTVTNI